MKTYQLPIPAVIPANHRPAPNGDGGSTGTRSLIDVGGSEAPPVTLRSRLARGTGLIRLIGVHDVMGARLAERSGFDGVWASSLEITTADGRLDDGLKSADHVLKVSGRIAGATTLPLVSDCQVEHNRPDHLIERIRSLAAQGVAAVCMQDSLFPCPNSLLPGEHPLTCRKEFAAAIAIARAHAPARMAVLARVQALVAGAGEDEARRRAHAYVSAGADAIVIHSRQSDPTEIMSFIDHWESAKPLVLIPSTFPQLTASQAAATGKVRMMIYANQGLRASLSAMQRVYREILRENSTLRSERWIAPLDDVFQLQSDPRSTLA